ncbi:MAG TPA: hypothetical protein PKH33_01525 [bacterium]|nr:hypothetical protein [bacterium]
MKSKKAKTVVVVVAAVALTLVVVLKVAIDVKFGVKADKWKPKEGTPAWSSSAPVPDIQRTTPEDSTFEERRAKTLAVAANPEAKSLLESLLAVRAGLLEKIPDEIVEESAKILDTRDDCADFTMIRVVRALYEHSASPVLTSEQYARLKGAVLNFKYWVDEPGPDKMISWTENHQILFHSSEYLMGQMFPDETFKNDWRKGREHMKHAEPYIRKWIDRRARWGFSEWDSNVYMAENLPAILALADYSLDPEMSRLATMAYDLALFDIGSDLYRGMYAGSHGRTYTKKIVSGRDDSVRGVIYQVWGYGYPTPGMSSTSLAMSRSYRPPQAIVNAGRALQEEYLTRERHGVRLQDLAMHGLDPKNPDDLVFLWGMSAFTQHQVVAHTLAAFHKWDLWKHPFVDSAPKEIKLIPANGLTAFITRFITIESDRALLSEVNKIGYRTPDYFLGSALDYMPGYIGNQHHIWQAMLSPDAVVFTSHPGSPVDEGDRTPTYWGHNRLPRVAQHKNVLVAVYNLKNTTVLGQRNFHDYTHAFFPKWAFDAVETKGNWTFAKKGDGYVALYSSVPTFWAEEGRDAGAELVAPGRKTIWICQLGRRATDGSFDRFKASILGADLKTNGLNVDYDAPGVGKIRFGWKGDFTVNGNQEPMRGFKRFDNPYCQADFNKGEFAISAGGSKLTLDFAKAVRQIED